jgi:hypothetical protein
VISVDVNGVGTVDFPDSMDQGEIAAAIHHRFSADKDKPLTIKSSPYDQAALEGQRDPGMANTSDFTKEFLADPETSIYGKTSRALDAAGKALVAAPVDVAKDFVGYHDPGNIEAALRGDQLPIDQSISKLPAIARAPIKGVEGVVESAPRIAAAMVDPALGAAAFGVTPQGFDPKQAAMAMLLPEVGKYTGAITEAVATKAGVTSDLAKAALNKVGGVAGVTSLLSADEARRIAALPPEQRKDAIVDAAGNIGAMALLGAAGESKRPPRTPDQVRLDIAAVRGGTPIVESVAPIDQADALIQQAAHAMPAAAAEAAKVQPEAVDPPAKEGEENAIQEEAATGSTLKPVQRAEQERLSDKQVNDFLFKMRNDPNLQTIKALNNLDDDWFDSIDDPRRDHVRELIAKRKAEIIEARGGPTLKGSFTKPGQPPTTGEPNAEGIRSDTQPATQAGEIPQGGQGGGGANLEQPPSEQPEPVEPGEAPQSPLPLNPGGPPSALSPEQQAVSKANNSREAFEAAERAAKAAQPESSESHEGTALKNAVAELERVGHGLPEATPSERQDMSEAWVRSGETLARDPAAGKRLADDLVADPKRGLTADESALLLRHKTGLMNALNDAAEKSITGTPEEKISAAADTARLLDEYTKLLDAIHERGSEWGREGRWRQAISYDDYSFATQERLSRAAGRGEPLTEQERDTLISQLNAIKDKMASAEQKQAEAEQRARESDAAKAASELAAEAAKKPLPFHPKVIDAARRIVGKIHSKADEARARMQERLKYSNMSVDPTVLYDLALIGADHLSTAALNLAEWTAKMAEEFGPKWEQFKDNASQIYAASLKQLDAETKNEGGTDRVRQVAKAVKTLETQKQDAVDGIKDAVAAGKNDEIGNLARKLAKIAVTEGARGWREVADAVHAQIKGIMPDWDYRDTVDAFTGHGKFSLPKQDEVSRELGEAVRQGNEVRKIQEVIAKEPVRPTGFVRRTAGDAYRRLIKIYNEAKRRFGVKVVSPEVQLRSALQARETYYANRIKDLKYEIATNKRIVRSKSPPPTSPKLEALQKELEQVQSEHQRIFGDRQLTDDQKLKMAQAGVQRQIAEYERRIKEGDFTDGAAKKPLTGPALEAAKARRDALRDQFNELRDLDDHFQSEKAAKTLESQRQALENAISEKERQLKEGDTAPKGAQVNRPASPELEELKQRRDALNKQLSDARKGPQKSPEERALQAFKTRTSNRIAELKEQLATGEFSTRARRTTALDPAAEKLKAEAARLKNQVEQARFKKWQANRPAWQRKLDSLVKWRQVWVISGIRSLGKLAGASIESIGILPAREAMGRVLTKLPGLRTVAERAPVEGGHAPYISTEAKAIAETYRNFIDDFGRSLKGQKTDFEATYGGREATPPELVNFVGFLHGALKSPLARNVWTRAMKNQLAWAEKNGINISDEAVKMELGRRAYEESVFWKFQNRNIISKAYRAGLAVLEQRKGGEPSIGGKIASTLVKLETPVTTVPSNLVARVFEGVFGTATGSMRLARAYAKGIENLKPEEADLILRNFKTGSLGLALTMLGAFLPHVFGGFYQPGKKRDKKDVPFGATRILGHDLPAIATDNPFLIMPQFGATITRVMSSKFKKSDAETKGLLWGLYAAMTGAAEQQPFVREAIDAGKLTGPDARYIIGEQAKSFIVPAAVQNISEWTDKKAKERKPKTIPQHVEMGIPGLRQNVPSR